MTKRIGVLTLARPNFDVPYAEEMAAKAFAALDRAGIETVGPRDLLTDADAARSALARFSGERLDALMLLQTTFTDASMTVEIAEAIDVPLVIWAFPEPRTGGRLRLNSFCGLNLAAHALGRAGKPFRSLYRAPDGALVGDYLRAALGPGFDGEAASSVAPRPAPADYAVADRVLAAAEGKRIGLVGEHPVGFDTCRYDAEELDRLTGMSVEKIALGEVFARARAVPAEAVAARRADVAALAGIDAVDQEQLGRSLTLYDALDALKREKGLSAFALRCWPEMFVEYGCAVCGPAGMLNSGKVPAVCEADMYGAVTAYLLQEVAGEPAWVVDIVDMDIADQTSVVWHCGSAPMAMCDPQFRAEAQIHSNRRMPLLYQFPLKPGRVTVARISQAMNEPKLMVTGAEVIRAPMSFTGTSGVLRFDAPTQDALEALIGGGFEHHVGIVYGDHRGAVAALGERLGLPVVGLGA